MLEINTWGKKSKLSRSNSLAKRFRNYDLHEIHKEYKGTNFHKIQMVIGVISVKILPTKCMQMSHHRKNYVKQNIV